jgi:heme/copper-type cytochrome/quinol oxidase subunit 3
MSNNTQANTEIKLDETSACINHSAKKETIFSLLKYTVIGMLFGIVFVKAEIISLKSIISKQYKAKKLSLFQSHFPKDRYMVVYYLA